MSEVPFILATASRARDDADHCGDLCFHEVQEDGSLLLCVADGLGHGELAEEAARCAVSHVAAHGQQPLAALFKGSDVAARSTRGAVMGVGVVSPDRRQLTYACVGNIRGMVCGERALQRLPCTPGIVGAGYNPLRPVQVDLSSGDLILLFTDGLNERLAPPGAVKGAELQQFTDGLLRDWCAGRDDAAILACLIQIVEG